MPTSPTGNSRGFTLLELLVALFIMTLLSGVVMASIWPALAEARLRAGTRTVISALRYARSYAVAQRTDAAVVLDLARHGVSVEALVRDENGEETWQTVTTPAGRFRALPDGIAMVEVDPRSDDADLVTITFSVIGRSEGTRITLEDAKEFQRVIVVDAVTGQCTLVDD